MNMRKEFLILLVFQISIHSNVQYRLIGYVTDHNKQSLKDVSVVLLRIDSFTLVSGTITDEKGFFAFPQLKKDEYVLAITYVGGKPIIERIILHADKELHYVLDTNVELDEIVVTSDRSNIMAMTSSGSSFYLSAKAKEEKDIFAALQEIPKLSIDRNTRSITAPNHLF